MPVVVDSCITNLFVPGNIGSDAGDGAKPFLPTLVDPDDYDPDAMTYSLDYSKFYNSFYAGAV